MIIGIFGGTFSPIHKGHIGVANMMLKYVDEVHFLITTQNPFKLKSPIPFEDRLNMLELAIQENNKSDLIAIPEEGPVYMIDYLKRLPIDDKSNKFALIVGWDTYKQLDRWKDSDWIMSNIDIYVYMRGGEDNDTSEAHPDNVHFVESDLMWDYSSSAIQEMISKENQDDIISGKVTIDGLHTDVQKYIGLNNLYRK